jgi:predicted alpha/beta hydrolase family esterase
MINVDALILHGKPPRERYENPDLPKPHEANWLPWLASELAKRGLNTAIPQFPKPYEPSYDAYRAVIEQYDIEEGTVVAHSAGADFILHWLSENPGVSLRQLLLVAPWRDDKGKYGEFSDYTLDLDLPDRIGRITILNSLDDSQAIQDNVTRLRSVLWPTRLVEFESHGHFMLGNNMPDTTFPELLAEID